MLLALLIFIATIVLVIWQPRGLGVGWSASLGAVLALLTGVVGVADIPTVWGFVWNATFTFIAVILISLVLDEAGFFEWAALHVARWGRGSGRRLFVYLVLLGAAVAALFANDGAALVMTPIVFQMILALRFSPAVAFGLVIATGFIADTTSLPFVVSNLVNIVIADFFGIGFARYALVMVPVALVSLGASLVVLRLFFRKSIPGRYDVSALRRPAEAVADPTTFRAGVVVLVALLVGYFAADAIGVPVAILRLGLVLGRQGVLPGLAFAASLGMGVRLGTGKQVVSWVHVLDVVDVITKLATLSGQASVAGVYNVVAPNTVTQTDFARTLARVMRRPQWLRVPERLMRRLLGQQATLLHREALMRHAVLRRGVLSGRAADDHRPVVGLCALDAPVDQARQAEVGGIAPQHPQLRQDLGDDLAPVEHPHDGALRGHDGDGPGAERDRGAGHVAAPEPERDVYALRRGVDVARGRHRHAVVGDDEAAVELGELFDGLAEGRIGDAPRLVWVAVEGIEHERTALGKHGVRIPNDEEGPDLPPLPPLPRDLDGEGDDGFERVGVDAAASGADLAESVRVDGGHVRSGKVSGSYLLFEVRRLHRCGDAGYDRPRAGLVPIGVAGGGIQRRVVVLTDHARHRPCATPRGAGFFTATPATNAEPLRIGPRPGTGIASRSCILCCRRLRPSTFDGS